MGKSCLTLLDLLLNRLFVPIVCILIYFKIIDAFNKHNLNFILILLVFLYLLRHLALQRDEYHRLALGPIGIALLFQLVVEALVYAGSSYRPNSFFALMESLAAFLFYYFVKHNIRAGPRHVALAVGMTIAGLLYFVGAMVRFTDTWPKLKALGFDDMTFFKDNLLYGDWIVNALLILPYPLILLFRFKDRAKWAFLLVPAIVLVSIPVIFSFSRGAYIAILAFVVLLNLAVIKFKLLDTAALIRFNGIMLVLAILVCSPFYKSVLSAASLLKTRSQTISLASRRQIWIQSLEMARKYPALGVGSYNFALAFAANAPRDASKGFIRTPQNTLVGIAAEKGLAGLLAYIGVLAAVLYVAGSKIVRLKDKFDQFTVASLTTALVASLIYLGTYYPPLGNQGSMALTFFIYAFLDGIETKMPA